MAEPVLRPGHVPKVNELRSAQAGYDRLITELPRVRAAAVAWRNGLAGLLAALVGFGLIKGRSDITQLEAGWSAVAGGLLLASLVAGAVGAVSLLRAAHGRPAVVDAPGLGAALLEDHAEALVSVRALRRGIVLVFGCAALLVCAVGVTWYGPGGEGPALRVHSPGGVVCGKVVDVRAGILTLEASGGRVSVDLRQATGVAPVSTCAP